MGSDVYGWSEIGRLGPPADLRPHVYFAEALGVADRVKIGWTAQPSKLRLRELQTGCPVKLAVCCHFPGQQDLERLMHEHFAQHRLHGEWFLVEGDLRELILLCAKKDLRTASRHRAKAAAQTDRASTLVALLDRAGLK